MYKLIIIHEVKRLYTHEVSFASLCYFIGKKLKTESEFHTKDWLCANKLSKQPKDSPISASEAFSNDSSWTPE